MDNNYPSCLVGCSLVLFLCCFGPIGTLCGHDRLCVCSFSITIRSGQPMHPRRLPMLLGKGDMIDLVLTIAIIVMAITITVGIETIFDWYIRY